MVIKFLRSYRFLKYLLTKVTIYFFLTYLKVERKLDAVILLGRNWFRFSCGSELDPFYKVARSGFLSIQIRNSAGNNLKSDDGMINRYNILVNIAWFAKMKGFE